jgi:hypothetical protein
MKINKVTNRLSMPDEKKYNKIIRKYKLDLRA